MTVQTQVSKVTANGNGVATSFSFSPIVIFKSGDIQVTKRSSTGVETLLVEGTGAANYTVVVAAYPGTGSVTYPSTGATRLATGETITIKRVLTYEQNTDLENQGPYNAETQETALDRLTMYLIQVQETLDRSLKFPVSDPASALGEIPNSVARANGVQTYDAAGKPTISAGIASVPVSAFWSPVLDDTSLSASLASLGFSASIQDFLLNVTDTTKGFVNMRRVNPTAVDVSWLVFNPAGGTISIAGSTTDGFAEAHSYAQANNYNLHVEGGGINTAFVNANVIAFLTSTRQTIGPFDSAIVTIKGVNFTFAGQGITSGTALTVDSFSKGVLDFDGQVVCNHAGVALEFRPSTNHTGDSNKNQGVADFHFRIIENASTAVNAVGVKFDAQTGEGLHGSRYRIEEVNGGRTGVEFTTAGTGVITGNWFEIWGVHGFLDAAGGVGVDIGTTGGALITGNRFDIEITTPTSSDYTAKINAEANEINISDLTSGRVKIDLGASAVDNTIIIRAPNAAGLTLTGTIGTNRVWFNGRLVTDLTLADPAGDVVTDDSVLRRIIFEARDTTKRTVAEIRAMHRSTNGTVGSLILAVRVADTLTDAIEIDENGRLVALAAPIYFKSYVKAALPSAAVAGGMIYVTDDVGGAVPAFSNGANWLRVTDRAVIA